MSDESSATIITNAEDFITTHLRTYLSSGGAQGHIMDISQKGGHFFATHCLIKHKGRKSGKTYVTPVCYGDIGGEVAIIASKGGADHHPDWYLNLCASPEIEFQVATQAFRGTWRELDGSEREKVWDFMAEGFPFFADYKRATERKIPVLLLNAVEEIPVFKESDVL
ncbi:MAG: nitroreductase family deazaflavin-dependent oxidoreductase [Sphingomonadaceae bacterium]|nr:nitroreductase family deazaflavin-dependent oxidoreductase [Sphingomonadaceae bacterium]